MLALPPRNSNNLAAIQLFTPDVVKVHGNALNSPGCKVSRRFWRSPKAPRQGCAVNVRSRRAKPGCEAFSKEACHSGDRGNIGGYTLGRQTRILRWSERSAQSLKLCAVERSSLKSCNDQPL